MVLFPLICADGFVSLGLLLPWNSAFLCAVLIFASLFPVLVVRKADLHGTVPYDLLCNMIVDLRPHSNPLSLIAAEILSPSAIYTVVAYLVSGVCLGGLYLRNASDEARLSITIVRS
jgi:Nucleoporin protein Ndc1-Nup